MVLCQTELIGNQMDEIVDKANAQSFRSSGIYSFRIVPTCLGLICFFSLLYCKLHVFLFPFLGVPCQYRKKFTLYLSCIHPPY